jgi:putative membrane protein
MNVNNTGSGMVDQNAVDFADKAATGGKLEVELGNLAEKKANRQRVKDFGKMMVDDHTKANNDLEAIASRENISLPSSVTKDQEKAIDKLSKKAGKDFDRAYIGMMVKDHKEDIKEFKEAEGKVTDNDIKNFITATLPVLEKHLDSIQAIRSGM